VPSHRPFMVKAKSMRNAERKARTSAHGTLRDSKLRHVRKGRPGTWEISMPPMTRRNDLGENNEPGRGSRSRSTVGVARTQGNLAEGPCRAKGGAGKQN
jgi:hypothetical protein